MFSGIFILKPKYSFVNLMGIVHKSCTSSQSPVNLFVRNHQFRRKLHKNYYYRDAPENNSHRDMYIAPSSGHTSFNFNMPFKLILRRCEVVF